jgi:hypothetical protein
VPPARAAEVQATVARAAARMVAAETAAREEEARVGADQAMGVAPRAEAAAQGLAAQAEPAQVAALIRVSAHTSLSWCTKRP